MGKYTPMIEQYLSIKAEYRDAFLFFRLGDFYEMFFEDAIAASQQLEITLTSREGGTEERIPMCGVPYHAADNYIHQLISKGFKVAICEQTEDPKQAKGVVRREVVQLITPGTVMSDKIIQEKENNFIGTFTEFEEGLYGVGFIDLTTGENIVTRIKGDFSDVLSELQTIGPKEIVLSPESLEKYEKRITDQQRYTVSLEEEVHIPVGFELIVIEIEDKNLQATVSRLLHYILTTQKRSLDHIQVAKYYELQDYMKMDVFSKRNLELVETIRTKGKKGSLLWLLDKTVTAMGGRLLKQWVERPLLNGKAIQRRLNMVETLKDNFFVREELKELLKEVYDLERLAGKISFGSVNARDFIQLKNSLFKIPVINQTLEELNHPDLLELMSALDPCQDLGELLSNAIKDHPPLSIKEGDMIKDGFHELLDQYRDASKNGKKWIAELEAKEREHTGIKSLKIGYNRVFGYYIEVTRANLHLLEEGRYERKQTLTNAERYITTELKEKEALILKAEENIAELEYQLFVELREKAKAYITKLQGLAKGISTLDVLQCFATISEQYHYTKPEFSETRRLEVRDGRHPVVEKVMNTQEYVPNDCVMDENREILIITGPNMSGKSTFMRQLALTAIMAQIGCFVPAKSAVLPIFDQIFTRIGAADDLVSGQSTFMVEMMETKQAVVKATKNSLILLDEIGRGTSTYDGMALAQAIIEYIEETIKAKTLFSTHYHELTALSSSHESIQNVHVKAVEQNGKVVFLHKVMEGFADKSYGIHVAELAQLPEKLIKRAREILLELETTSPSKNSDVKVLEKDLEQLSFFGEENKQANNMKFTSKEKQILDKLNRLNVLELTPMDAMNQLYEIQKLLKK